MKKATAKKSSGIDKLEHRPFRESLRDRLFQARQLAGLSQKTLGERCGWFGPSGQVRVAQYEAGRTVPDLLDILNIAAACDVRPITLAFGPQQFLPMERERLQVIYESTDDAGRTLINGAANVAADHIPRRRRPE